jgi:hypothetical protein
MAASSRLRRPRRSPEEIRRLVGEFRAGGQSQRRFALSRGIHPITLGRWLRRTEDLEAAATTGHALIPVRLLEARFPPRTPGQAVEVVLRNQRVLRVPEDFDGARLARLVDLLEAGC